MTIDVLCSDDQRLSAYGSEELSEHISAHNGAHHDDILLYSGTLADHLLLREIFPVSSWQD